MGGEKHDPSEKVEETLEEQAVAPEDVDEGDKQEMEEAISGEGEEPEEDIL